MIKEHYPLLASASKRHFRFKSIGEKRVIDKFVLFERLAESRYNLAFGDIIGEELHDEDISNNRDPVKVISTVAKAVYEFFEQHPDAILEIEAIDEKRLIFYNAIFKRRQHEIEQIFEARGIWEKGMEIYNPAHFYQKFEIQIKSR
ncbi:MAG: hypothetical protein EPO28_08255 [Saprospiraceae bacterium]|nr:MAG: hypothetical protein EPO28_08255 [Saprospiraceae bacterium]